MIHNHDNDVAFIGIIDDAAEHVDLTVGIAVWQTSDGWFIEEEDLKVAGEVWRVHKNDPDPYPSRPHAHCVGGAQRFIGCKLHLGTAELYDGRQALGRYLGKKQFVTLIELIRPKFPGLQLPLAI